MFQGLRTVIDSAGDLEKAKEWYSHRPIQEVGGGVLVGSVIDPFGNVGGVIQNPHFKLA